MATINIREAIGKAGVEYLPLSADDPGAGIGQLMSRVFTLALVFAGLAVFMYLILGGYNWLTAGGDKGKVEEARTRITNALIGLAIVASALALGNLVNNFFGTGISYGGAETGGGGGGTQVVQ